MTMARAAPVVAHVRRFARRAAPATGAGRRRRGERADCSDIVERRAAFSEQLADDKTPYDPHKLQGLLRAGYKTRHNQKAAVLRRRGDAAAIFLGSGLDADFPPNELPEVALIGQSNCGKSSLLNAFIGSVTGEGLAPVSPRAGWTAQLGFYALEAEYYEETEPRLVLVDLPGYGPAVGDKGTRQRWRRAIKQYLRERRQLLSVLVLVDCERGLEEDDEQFLAGLQRRGTPHAVVLTRCDLLPPVQLARCHYLVTRRLEALGSPAADDVPAVSVLTGVGIEELWLRLLTGVVSWAEQQQESQLSQETEVSGRH